MMSGGTGQPPPSQPTFEESALYGDNLPFTGIGSAVLTAAALVTTAIGGVLAFAAGPIATGLGAAAGLATRLGLRRRRRSA